MNIGQHQPGGNANDGQRGRSTRKEPKHVPSVAKLSHGIGKFSRTVVLDRTFAQFHIKSRIVQFPTLDQNLILARQGMFDATENDFMLGIASHEVSANGILQAS